MRVCVRACVCVCMNVCECVWVGGCLGVGGCWFIALQKTHSASRSMCKNICPFCYELLSHLEHVDYAYAFRHLFYEQISFTELYISHQSE